MDNLLDGGVLVLKDSKEGLGSAYFIFTLSLLMEVIPQINKKNEFVSRAFHTVFCFAISVILIMSIKIILISKEQSNTYYNIMFYFSIGVLGYIGLDCILLWLGKDINSQIKIEKPSFEDTQKIIEQNFVKSLMSGNLGNIKER